MKWIGWTIIIEIVVVIGLASIHRGTSKEFVYIGQPLVFLMSLLSFAIWCVLQ